MKLRSCIPVLLLLLTGIFLSGCRQLNPSIMLKTPRGFTYDIPPDTLSPEYTISATDMINFRLFSNDGFMLIDLSTINQTRQNINLGNSRNAQYLVEFDGTVKLPTLGRVDIAGLTVRQAEIMLESRYADIYIKPFVMLNIQNRRVIMFSGSGNSARVINLQNENTTLIEALALGGGITGTGKAHKIKLIRGKPDNPEVYLIDLSTIDGIKDGNMVLQANDIIYVEPMFRFTRELLQEIAPLVGLMTNILLIIGFWGRLSN